MKSYLSFSSFGCILHSTTNTTESSNNVYLTLPLYIFSTDITNNNFSSNNIQVHCHCLLTSFDNLNLLQHSNLDQNIFFLIFNNYLAQDKIAPQKSIAVKKHAVKNFFTAFLFTVKEYDGKFCHSAYTINLKAIFSQ
jgi:hypothetical protein